MSYLSHRAAWSQGVQRHHSSLQSHHYVGCEGHNRGNNYNSLLAIKIQPGHCNGVLGVIDSKTSQGVK